jgi:F420-dependent oxidoreductase-like protein
VRFGITAPQSASFRDILGLWREADILGFDTAFVCDHFMMPNPGPAPTQRCFEAWSLLGALAARTHRLRLGVLVSGNTYRHPAVVAKMAATIDHVSRGRLILGLGAGWMEREHRAYGIPFHTAGGRARRLGEAVEVIKRLFTEESASFNGKYYTLKDAPCEPKPLQKPHPPILIGGMGPKVVQPLAARHAQIWHLIVPGGNVTAIRRACESFDRLCREVGRDPAEVEKAASCDPSQLGTGSGALRDRLRALVDAGVRHFVLLPPPNDRTVLRRFATEIIPHVRAG